MARAYILVCIMCAMCLANQSFSPRLPCVRRLKQLYCRDAGEDYPSEEIDEFIDFNKALIWRMFGTSSHGAIQEDAGQSSNDRAKRGLDNMEDSCPSTHEVTTPYWAANSAGQLRAIVNNKHFPQAIHQEICSGNTSRHCGDQCHCQQKLAYHRLLAYDPTDACRGIFIDWFLFPSCCVCRCPAF